MQLLLPCAQLKKEENCWKMQSKLEAAKMAQACAQMSICCFHNSLSICLFWPVHFTIKLCQHSQRCANIWVEIGRNLWRRSWKDTIDFIGMGKVEPCISCSGPEMRSPEFRIWSWSGPNGQIGSDKVLISKCIGSPLDILRSPFWMFKVPILDVQGLHFGCSRSPLKLRTMLKYILYQTSLISLPPNWSTPSQGSCNRS